MAKLIKRFGIEFFGTSARVRVEDGLDNLGETDYDPKRGTQTFYFKDEAAWERHRKGIFEAHQHFEKPVPFFEAEIAPDDVLVAEVKTKPVKVEPVVEIKPPVQPEPADPSDPVQPPVEPYPGTEETKSEESPRTQPLGIAEIVAIVNEGKKIRFKEIAERLGVDPEFVKQVITETPKSPVTIGQGGWVSIIA